MPSFTKIKEFETDNDLNGFEQLIENLYLKASFPALLSLATTLKEGKGEFYDAAFRLWMKKFLEYTNTSSSAAKNVYIAEAISALIIDSQLPVEEPIAMYNEQTDDNKELIRRMLFTYLRNTAPGGGRVRPRKALILMGSSSVKENEEAFTPSLWILYTELLKYTISGDPTFLKKAVDSCKHTITQHEEGALEFILESLQDSSLKELIMTVPDPDIH